MQSIQFSNINFSLVETISQQNITYNYSTVLDNNALVNIIVSLHTKKFFFLHTMTNFSRCINLQNQHLTYLLTKQPLMQLTLSKSISKFLIGFSIHL